MSLPSRAAPLDSGRPVSCFHSLKSVERSDAGRYWCQVEDGDETETSQPVWLTVEGEEAEPQGCVDLSRRCLLGTTPMPKEAQWNLGGRIAFWDPTAPDSRPSPYMQDLGI